MHTKNMLFIMALSITISTAAEVKVVYTDEDDNGSMHVNLGGGLGTVVYFNPEEEEKYKKRLNHLKTKGYIDRENETAKIDIFLEHAKNTLTKENAKKPEDRTKGFKVLEKGKILDKNSEEIPFTPIKTKYKKSGNEGYAFLDAGGVNQVHTETTFGALVIQEYRGRGEAIIKDPNVQILGGPAKLEAIQYKGQRWATVVYVPRDELVLFIECDKKLEGEDRLDFLQLAEDIILENGY